jgi:type I restriction enzyme S subunit
MIAKKNDILMVMSDVPNGRAIAKCFLVNRNKKYSVNQRICLLRSNVDNPTFLYYKIDRNSYYLSFDDGVKQTNLRKDDVLGCKLKVPKIEEQKAIAQILSDMDAEIEALNKKLEKYKKIKQGMMEELLTGRVRLV